MSITIQSLTPTYGHRGLHYLVDFDYEDTSIATCVTSDPAECHFFFVTPIDDFMKGNFGKEWRDIYPPPTLAFGRVVTGLDIVKNNSNDVMTITACFNIPSMMPRCLIFKFSQALKEIHYGLGVAHPHQEIFTAFFNLKNCVYVGEGIEAKRTRLVAKGWECFADWRDLTTLSIAEEPGVVIRSMQERAVMGIKPRCYASHLARLYLGLEVPPNDVMEERGFREEMLEMPLIKYACIRSYIYFMLGMKFVNPKRD